MTGGIKGHVSRNDILSERIRFLLTFLRLADRGEIETFLIHNLLLAYHIRSLFLRMNMVIRQATKKDIPAVAALAASMIDFHHILDTRYRASTAYDDLRAMVTEWLADHSLMLLVAEDAGALIGYMRIGEESAPAYLAPECIGIIYDIFIEPQIRKRGVARALVDEANAWFMARGIQCIELSVDTRNATGLAFWEKLGFSGYRLRMKKMLF